MYLKIDLIEENNLEDVLSLFPNFIGVNFSKQEPRNVEMVLNTIPNRVKIVGVFVNEELENIITTIFKYNLKMVEIHGSNNLSLCKKIKKETKVAVVKSIAVIDSSNFWVTKQYEGVVDLFLFDTQIDIYKNKKQRFNWQLLNDYKGETEFILKGNITQDDLKMIKEVNPKKMIVIQPNRIENFVLE